MANDEDGDWVPLVKVVHRGELPDERWMLDRIASGQYPMRWLDEQGAQHIGKLPEHMWRAGHVDTLFGLLSFNGRDYQRIEIQLPREGVEQREPEPIEAPAPEPELIEEATDAPDMIARNKPSRDDVGAAVRALETEYGPDARPAEIEIWGKVKALHPTATRQQVRDALEDSPLKGLPGYKAKKACRHMINLPPTEWREN